MKNAAGHYETESILLAKPLLPGQTISGKRTWENPVGGCKASVSVRTVI